MIKKTADRYIGLSKFTMPFMLKLGLPKEKLVTLPNAIDTIRFRPNDKIKTDNVILFVGRIGPEKGLDTLLQALFHLKTQARLFIVGPIAAPEPFFSHVQDLIRKINDVTCHEVVYLGPLHGDPVIELYQKAAVFVSPSRIDHFPMTNLEAMACNTPVITTAVGAIPEVVKNEVNGLLVQPNEPQELANALHTLLENKKLREFYGRNGRHTVEEHYSWTVVLDKVVKIYGDLLATKYDKP